MQSYKPSRVLQDLVPIGLLLTLPLGYAACVNAQVSGAESSFPNRTLTIVVPTGTGGQTDVYARLIAENLRVRLGQPVVVENKPGAGGIVAGRYLASKPADGYTLMYGSMSTIITAPQLQQPIAYDSRKAFVPVALTQSGTTPIAISATLPFQSARELIEYAKRNPGKLNYGSQGVGSVGHLAIELLAGKTGVSFVHIPFSGTGAALVALLGGQVDLVLVDILTTRPHVQAGKIRYLTQVATQRSPALPNIPTVAEELNIPELAMDFWLGMFAPLGTPEPIVQRLSQEIAAVMNLRALKERLETSTMSTPAMSSEQFSRLIAAQWDIWGKVIRDNSITAN
jgi:tripartite-type tricarboxylate transporter receptor subunit TctC